MLELFIPDRARTMRALVVYNGGFFKSEKQAEFIRDCWAREYTREELEKIFGISVPGESAKIVFIEGVMQHSCKRGRSEIPYTLAYVLDSRGVESVYRVRYKGNLKDGAVPDTGRTELKWRRERSGVDA